MECVNKFDEVIARAKTALNVAGDAELAKILDMTPAAFSNRKKTQSIPYDKLIEVLESRNIDFRWIFTGSIDPAALRNASFAAIEVALHFAPLSQSLISDMQQAALNEKLDKEQLMERFKSRLPVSGFLAKELTLVDNYRTASKSRQEIIEEVAKLAVEAERIVSYSVPNEDIQYAVAPRYTVDFGKSNIGQAIAGDVKNNKFRNKQK